MEKSPFIKKSPEIKSYQFETFFSRTFFLVPVWFYTKTSPERSPILVDNTWEQRMFTTMTKKGQLILKCRSIENVLDLTSCSQNSGLFSWFFFLRIYFLQDFISWDLIGRPHTILGKKIRGIKTQNFISSDILS